MKLTYLYTILVAILSPGTEAQQRIAIQRVPFYASVKCSNGQGINGVILDEKIVLTHHYNIPWNCNKGDVLVGTAVHQVGRGDEVHPVSSFWSQNHILLTEIRDAFEFNTRVQRAVLPDSQGHQYPKWGAMVSMVHFGMEVRNIPMQFKLHYRDVYIRQHFKQGDQHYYSLQKELNGKRLKISDFKGIVGGPVWDSRTGLVLGALIRPTDSPGDYLFFSDFSFYRAQIDERRAMIRNGSHPR